MKKTYLLLQNYLEVLKLYPTGSCAIHYYIEEDEISFSISLIELENMYELSVNIDNDSQELETAFYESLTQITDIPTIKITGHQALEFDLQKKIYTTTENSILILERLVNRLNKLI